MSRQHNGRTYQHISGDGASRAHFGEYYSAKASTKKIDTKPDKLGATSSRTRTPDFSLTQMGRPALHVNDPPTPRRSLFTDFEMWMIDDECGCTLRACLARSCTRTPPSSPAVASVVARLQTLLKSIPLHSERKALDGSEASKGPQTTSSGSHGSTKPTEAANDLSQPRRKRGRSTKNSNSGGEEEDGEDRDSSNNGREKRMKPGIWDYYFLCIFCTDSVGFCRKKDGQWDWSKSSRFCDLMSVSNIFVSYAG